jgi:hypothetical protein
MMQKKSSIHPRVNPALNIAPESFDAELYWQDQASPQLASAGIEVGQEQSGRITKNLHRLAVGLASMDKPIAPKEGFEQTQADEAIAAFDLWIKTA